LPEHLRSLYEESCADLNEVDCEKLMDLLTEYEEVFSANDLDMGRTGLI
jgi:hypothetical protein